jgi:arylsulfatase A-like enzyme
MAAMHDLAPTILRMAEAQPSPEGAVFDGRSLLPLVRRPAAADRRTLVLEAGDDVGGYAFRGLLRGDGWKYIEFSTDGVNEVEMYDLTSDPFELRNLADDPRYADERARLDRQLDRLKDCAGAQCP